MYRKLSLIFFFAISMYMPNMAFSHADHGAPLSETQMLEQAIKYTGMIVDRPNAIEGVVLNESWRTVKQASIQKKTVQYSIVSIHNASESKTLFMLISPFGELQAANFDGDFDEELEMQ